MDSGPWNAEKILRKGSKHILFFILSFLISNTFLAYVIGMDDLVKIITEPVSQHLGGFHRHHRFHNRIFMPCSHLPVKWCAPSPVPMEDYRAYCDRNSVVVAYDYQQGEPGEKEEVKNNLPATVSTAGCVSVCAPPV